MGDLYVAVGTEALHSSDKARQAKAPQSFEKAMERYAAAGNAPWAGADAGLSLKRGQALLAQNKTDEASKAFQAVISGAAGPQAEALKMAAQLGRARALAASNQAEEGVKLAEDVIAKAPKNDEELNGQAYLALGACHRAANKPHEAVLAYLHVDLLYSQNPQIHAEALAALSKLWATLNRPDRARAASAMLADKYPNSYWNR
jgi:tetratricopeptide (TPR) repeat protein